ncbi:hypothetical protein [Bradyrhizobium sp.]|uniref:hypothetical protein n=1 Tax=Bradyrhizobium sp. TaxID=376 RepID=UPI003C772AC1
MRSDDPRQDGEEIWTKRPVEFDRSLRFSDTEVRRLRVLAHGETILLAGRTSAERVVTR